MQTDETNHHIAASSAGGALLAHQLDTLTASEQGGSALANIAASNANRVDNHSH
jgi:hypothetical protein